MTSASILAVLIAMTFRSGLASQLYTTLVFIALVWLIDFGIRRADCYALEASTKR
jgi:hypothetical protein